MTLKPCQLLHLAPDNGSPGFVEFAVIKYIQWVPVTTSNLIYENVLVISGTRCNELFEH